MTIFKEDQQIDALYEQGKLPKPLALIWGLCNSFERHLQYNPGDDRFVRLPREDAVRMLNTIKHIRGDTRLQFRAGYDHSQALVAENTRLQEALRPFAEAAARINPETDAVLVSVSVVEWRTARAALRDIKS